MRERCHVFCVTGASNWYWLTVGQGQLPLQQVWVEGYVFTPSVSSLSFIFLLLHSPSFISSTISVIPFSGRIRKVTHKDWRAVKPQHSQSIMNHNVFIKQIQYLIQTVQTLIRCRVLRHLIWVYTFCQCPFNETLGIKRLITAAVLLKGCALWLWPFLYNLTCIFVYTNTAKDCRYNYFLVLPFLPYHHLSFRPYVGYHLSSLPFTFTEIHCTL